MKTSARGLLMAALLSTSCGSSSTGPSLDAIDSVLDCSTGGQNQFVADKMKEMYLWYREMPTINPRGYASPYEVLDALRYKTYDTTFSYINTKAEDEAYRARSEYVGFGFSSRLVGPTELRVTHVYPGSPSADAGMDRGTEILAVDGRSMADIVNSGQLGSAFGPSDPGVTKTLRFRTRDGVEIEATMVKRVVAIPPVGAVRIYTVDGTVVGYIELANFTEPTRAALDGAFAQLKQAGATELVLDVRYNGGGLVSIAQHLAGLAGGRRTEGQELARLVHNDKNTSRDQSIPFTNPPNALGLQRLFVITTRSSASASEMMVNGLRPFFTVVQVGDNSYGKPVGQYGYEFCDKIMFPVAFSVKNARGQGDYFQGLVPDCRAPDDITHELGDPEEASTAEALHYLRTGSCSAGAASAARAQGLRRPPERMQPHRENGWQLVLGAY